MCTLVVEQINDEEEEQQHKQERRVVESIYRAASATRRGWNKDGLDVWIYIVFQKTFAVLFLNNCQNLTYFNDFW